MITNRFSISLFFILLLFRVHTTFAQFSDNFTDGNFTLNPAWQGSTQFFTINSSKQLQSNGSGSDTIFLVTPSQKLIDAEWQFWLRMNFSPSNQNYIKIYLASDQADLTGNLNGYFIRIGENLSLDGIDLFRQEGAVITPLINGTDGHGAIKPLLRIKVIHRANGDWELYSDTTGGSNFVSEGIANDNIINTSDYFGIVCGFTSSNAKNFYFDDFYAGNITVDTTAPRLTNIKVIDATTLQIGFDEALDQASASLASNYIISNGIGIPSSASWLPVENESELKLGSSLSSLQSYHLVANAIKDLHDNTMQPDSISFFTFFPIAGDVVINEIFPDPSPVIGLPDAEFIEIFNTKQHTQTVFCSNWQLADASTTVTIPDFEMSGNTHIILCNATDTLKFSSYGRVLGVPGFQTLNNDGDNISIISSNGTILDQVDYDISWYHNQSKQDGGYSLERINPYLACSDATNWTASSDALGGTPGKQNSVYSDLPDKTAPTIDELIVIDPVHLIISFDKMMDQYSLTNPASYTISPDIVHPQSVLTLSDRKSVQLTLGQALKKETIYNLTISNVIDCSGNAIGANKSRFGLPEPADSFDVVINEILFNPHPNGFDFVELFNRSSKIISLKDLKICTFDSNNQIKTPYFISSKSGQLFPGEYIAFSENKEDIENRYMVKYPENLFEIPDLPSFNDDEGVVGILNSSNRVIDKFNYDKSYHFKLIDNEEGVSLERISPEYKTQDPVNWTSAASSAGYATPAYQNSHYQTETPVTDKVTIDPQTFSPDNDGFQDELLIQLKLDNSNYFGSITIYDLSGREVRKLANNDLFGNENLYKWDGVDNNGSKSAIGVYIILFEINNTNGSTEKIKKTCTLAAR
jgi:hypothetical protein